MEKQRTAMNETSNRYRQDSFVSIARAADRLASHLDDDDSAVLERRTGGSYEASASTHPLRIQVTVSIRSRATHDQPVRVASSSRSGYILLVAAPDVRSYLAAAAADRNRPVAGNVEQGLATSGFYVFRRVPFRAIIHEIMIQSRGRVIG